jgi:O-antigen ligase
VPFVTVELLTASRGGLVAMLAPIPILLWGYSKSTGSQKATGVFLILLAALVVSVVVPSTTWDRLSELAHLSNSDLGDRRGIWDAGFAVWEQQYGLFGTGAGGYYAATYDYFEEGGHTAHNVYVSILTELGFIGFLIFAILGINIVREVNQLPFQQRMLSYAMLAVWGVHSLSSGNEYAKTTWFLIGLLMTMTVNYQNAVMAEKPVIKTQLPILPVQPLYPPQYQSTHGQQND